MRKIILLLTVFAIFHTAIQAQNTDEKAILKILDDQTRYWNQGDLDHFVTGYWHNDSVMFIGGKGVVYGYQNTLDRYKKNYKDTAAMGKLHFDILHVKKLSTDYYFVVGKWFLKRTIGDAEGHYTLLFRKIKGQWKIIADHSS